MSENKVPVYLSKKQWHVVGAAINTMRIDCANVGDTESEKELKEIVHNIKEVLGE